jgi:hypothetical protein
VPEIIPGVAVRGQELLSFDFVASAGVGTQKAVADQKEKSSTGKGRPLCAIKEQIS